MPEDLPVVVPEEPKESTVVTLLRVFLTPENFRVFVRSAIAFFAIIWGGAFLWKATFTAADKMSSVAEFIIGFVTASVVGIIMTFYFGSSDKPEPKEATIEE